MKYTLFPRKLSSGFTWYYYPYKDGKRLPARSTGQGFKSQRDKAKSRKAAESYVLGLIESGMMERKNTETLSDWIEKKHFWDFDRSEYVRGILARSAADKPGITEGYCQKSGAITEARIIPYHGNKAIEQITPYDCEQLLFEWKAVGVSNKTVNNWKYIYSTILSEYENECKMKNPKSSYMNPWKAVKPFGKDSTKYGGLTVDEVKRILIDSPDNPIRKLCYLACKIAFLTGLRMGEVCGLQVHSVRDEYSGDIRMSYLMIDKQYDFKLKKLTLTKDKETRMIPISASLRDELSPYMRSAGFLLSAMPDKSQPLSPNRIRAWLYKRMEAVGISDREKRKIAFHSARRFFNTLLRQAQVADSTIQRFTGHDSLSMTEHYTDYLPEDLQEVARAQSKLLEE